MVAHGAPTAPFKLDYGTCPACGGNLVLGGATPLRFFIICRGKFGLQDGCGYTDVRLH